MAVAVPANRVLRFGAYEVNLATRELRKKGSLLKLRPQAARVLVLLLTHAGEVITREQLKQEVWGEGLFVDFEHGLNLCIRQIRAVLDDDAERPRYIETLPRLGYRFIARIEEATPDSGVPAYAGGSKDPLTVIDGPRPSPKPDKPLRSKWLIAGSLGAGCAILAALIFALPGLRDRLRLSVHPTHIESVAVLPLENLSRDPEQDYFADGMTDELITELAKVHALRVISRNSIMQYKGKHKAIPQVARELNVDAVVEGTVTRAGDQVRITAQLIEAPTDRHLWADKYEGDLRNVLALQDEVARSITKEVRINLTPQEQGQLTKARAVNPEAHEAYLHGLYELGRQKPDGIENSIAYFNRAIAIDPNDPLAHAALSNAYYNESSMVRAPLESMPKARAAAARAIELDDSIAEAHASLGYVKLTFDWDWSGAEQEFRRALELNSNLPVAHSGYALYLLTSGRTEEAIREAKLAQAVDPLVPVFKVSLPFLLWNAHHFEDALQAGRTAGNCHGMALAAASLGERDEAIANADCLVRATDSPVLRAQMAWVYAISGRQQQARTMLHSLEAMAQKHYVCAYNIAGVYAGLGDPDQTFAWLDQAYRDRSD